MVDFSKYQKKDRKESPIDPIEIFLSLPNTGINDLYNSQSSVLSQWFENRANRDSIIKLHTGGGKTLVGLLIAKSIMNELHGPVLYLTPDNQLKMQVSQLAQQYKIEVETYDSNYSFSNPFLNGEKVLIASYQALFNGQSRFGVRDGKFDILRLAGIVLDDAHVASSLIRDQFTMSLSRKSDAFQKLRSLFRADFGKIGRIGIFDDLEIGRSSAVLEVPYWALKNKETEIRAILGEVADDYYFQWPLVRDNIENCHILIGSRNITLTPIALDVDLFPAFSECPRRVFMSATIRDHGEIIRSFNINLDPKRPPLTARTVAGIGEKMVIMPDLVLGGDSLSAIKTISLKLHCKLPSIAVIRQSEKQARSRWEDFGEVVTKEQIDEAVRSMLGGTSVCPTIFVNRYNGMDLKGDACRVLILDGLPKEVSDYDRYRAMVTSGGESRANIIASRIEQGVGRSSRGSGDFSVVFLIGHDLTNWVNLKKNMELLTISTKTQVEMGVRVTKDLTSKEEISEVANQCLDRDESWISFHNQELVDAIESEKNYIDQVSLEGALLERECYNLMKEGRYKEAFLVMKDEAEDKNKFGAWMLGWYKQLGARAAFFCGDVENSLTLQDQAYALNRNLTRPEVLSSYLPLTPPNSQSSQIDEKMGELSNRRGIVDLYRACTFNLTMGRVTSNQFEEALKDLGEYFGFKAERPDHDTGKGPDVLWLTPDRQGFVIEVKSDKKANSAFDKDDNGQLLNSIQWFESRYPGFECVPLIVMPKNIISGNAELNPLTRVMDSDKLASIISAGMELINKVSGKYLASPEEHNNCENTIKSLSLDLDGIVNKYTFAANSGT